MTITTMAIRRRKAVKRERARGNEVTSPFKGEFESISKMRRELCQIPVSAFGIGNDALLL